MTTLPNQQRRPPAYAIQMYNARGLQAAKSVLSKHRYRNLGELLIPENFAANGNTNQVDSIAEAVIVFDGGNGVERGDEDIFALLVDLVKYERQHQTERLEFNIVKLDDTAREFLAAFANNNLRTELVGENHFLRELTGSIIPLMPMYELKKDAQNFVLAEDYATRERKG